jgi:hypothetical protein
MTFDWIKFLSSEGIAFRQYGRSQLNTACPFCGESDYDRNNMSINIEGKGWRCWRDKQRHVGKSPVRLIQAYLKCSFEHAISLAGAGKAPESDLLNMVRSRIAPIQVAEQRKPLVMPAEFKTTWLNPSATGYRAYLKKRGISVSLAKQLGLRYCYSGEFAGRIIIPVMHRRKLVSWTGRSIHKQAEIRYLSASEEIAGRPINNYLLFYDELLRCEATTLCMCEGPFDAIKLWSLGRQRSIAATCFFTSSASDKQIDMLHSLLPKFHRRYLLLDQGTQGQAMRLTQQLCSLGVTIANLPPGFKDPGELGADITSQKFMLALGKSHR